MLLIGSDDGVYRLDDPLAPDAGPRRVLESEAVMRLRTFDGLPGVLAATASGLYHSPDGDSWTDLGVPERSVYAVGYDPGLGRLYAGSRPAAVYRADAGTDAELAALTWRECEAFQDLPSREDWRLPRHENLAQVRDLRADPAAPGRVVAGVEVGGVHVSEDGGETWVERRDGVDDDVHELAVVGPGEYVAACGFGLFRSRDAGRTWTRLDDGYDQRYFRSVARVGEVVYAGAALASSSSWEDADADPRLFALHEDADAIDPVAIPRPDETVTGIAPVDGRLAVGTHRGSLLVREPDGAWAEPVSFPVAADQTGRYTPLLAVET